MADVSQPEDGRTAVAVGSSVPARPAWARWLDVAVFVALWVALGFAFRLSADAYLLLGVPLTVAFQRLIRRRPLRQLWVRDAGPGIDTVRWRIGLPVAVALAVRPVAAGVAAAMTSDWVLVGWFAAAGVGALAAGYAVGRLRRPALVAAWRSASWAVVVGAALVTVAVAPRLSAVSGPPPVARMVAAGIDSLLVYLPAVFILEEVTFRGMLDVHVHPCRTGAGQCMGWPSAVYLSALWGLWHLPVTGGSGVDLVERAIPLLIFHISTGVFLSLTWRASRNLVLPAAAHAVLDGIRNGLQAGLP